MGLDRALKERFSRLKPLCFSIEVDSKTENYNMLSECIRKDKAFTLNNCFIQIVDHKKNKIIIKGFVGFVSTPSEEK